MPVTRELVRKGTHVAGALHVVLAAQRVNAHARPPDVAGGHREIRDAHHHRRALAVLGDTETVVDRAVATGRVETRRRAHGRVATVAVAQMSFKLPVFVGDEVSCYCAISHVGNTSVTVEVEVGHDGKPFFADPQSENGKAGQAALKSAFGKDPVLIREGGSIPIIQDMKEILGVEALMLGLALPDCQIHAPNENFWVENFEAGIRLNQALLKELAK